MDIVHLDVFSPKRCFGAQPVDSDYPIGRKSRGLLALLECGYHKQYETVIIVPEFNDRSVCPIATHEPIKTRPPFTSQDHRRLQNGPAYNQWNVLKR